jgi:hypothetical protein
MGIAMQADAKLGETPGGLQAPHVIKLGDVYHMFYGDWEHICHATSKDGKSFARDIGADGRPGLFTERLGANTRDPMAIVIGGRLHVYYTAYPDQKGAVFCRIAELAAPLREDQAPAAPFSRAKWSDSKRVAFGGAAGTNPFSAECPFVLYLDDAKAYYLFRTQRYGRNAQTTVYRSADPLNFGVDDDKFRVCTLPVAAPEIIRDRGQFYIAALRGDLKGIQVARLRWSDK